MMTNKIGEISTDTQTDRWGKEYTRNTQRYADDFDRGPGHWIIGYTSWRDLSAKDNRYNNWRMTRSWYITAGVSGLIALVSALLGSYAVMVPFIIFTIGVLCFAMVGQFYVLPWVNDVTREGLYTPEGLHKEAHLVIDDHMREHFPGMSDREIHKRVLRVLDDTDAFEMVFTVCDAHRKRQKDPRALSAEALYTLDETLYGTLAELACQDDLSVLRERDEREQRMMRSLSENPAAKKAESMRRDRELKGTVCYGS